MGSINWTPRFVSFEIKESEIDGTKTRKLEAQDEKVDLNSLLNYVEPQKYCKSRQY